MQNAISFNTGAEIGSTPLHHAHSEVPLRWGSVTIMDQHQQDKIKTNTRKVTVYMMQCCAALDMHSSSQTSCVALNPATIFASFLSSLNARLAARENSSGLRSRLHYHCPKFTWTLDNQIWHCIVQVAELNGRLQEAEDNRASLLSKLHPTAVQSFAASADSNDDLSSSDALHTDGDRQRHVQRRNSDHSSVAHSNQQLQTKDESSASQHAADVSPLQSGQLCKTLQQIADSLTADAAKLKKSAQQQAESGVVQHEEKPFNWGFPVSNNIQSGGDKAGPVRPATAAPSDGNRQRPRRQWSAQHRWQPDDVIQDADDVSQRPLTAAGDMHMHQGEEQSSRQAASRAHADQPRGGASSKLTKC